jgi:hypothetical protein
MPPARVASTTTSRQWENAKIGASRPNMSVALVRMIRPSTGLLLISTYKGLTKDLQYWIRQMAGQMPSREMDGISHRPQAWERNMALATGRLWKLPAAMDELDRVPRGLERPRGACSGSRARGRPLVDFFPSG